MSMPKSVVKFKKGEVEYTSNVDACEYTLKELSRAALRDVARLARRYAKKEVPVSTGTLKKNIGTWVRGSKQGMPRLQIGVYSTKQAKKKNITPAYHTHLLEFGTVKMKAHPFLKPAVFNNIDKIREIEAKYLSGIETDVKDDFDENEEIKDD